MMQQSSRCRSSVSLAAPFVTCSCARELTFAFSTRAVAAHASDLTKHPVEGFSAGLIDDDNVYEWEITIFG